MLPKFKGMALGTDFRGHIQPLVCVANLLRCCLTCEKEKRVKNQKKAKTFHCKLPSCVSPRS